MTVMIEAGADTCFYVPNITEGQSFEFDFSVCKTIPVIMSFVF